MLLWEANFIFFQNRGSRKWILHFVTSCILRIGINVCTHTHVSVKRGKIRISDILKMGKERIEMK